MTSSSYDDPVCGKAAACRARGARAQRAPRARRSGSTRAGARACRDDQALRVIDAVRRARAVPREVLAVGDPEARALEAGLPCELVRVVLAERIRLRAQEHER